MGLDIYLIKETDLENPNGKTLAFASRARGVLNYFKDKGQIYNNDPYLIEITEDIWEEFYNTFRYRAIVMNYVAAKINNIYNITYDTPQQIEDAEDEVNDLRLVLRLLMTDDVYGYIRNEEWDAHVIFSWLQSNKEIMEAFAAGERIILVDDE